jgi:elongation factor P
VPKASELKRGSVVDIKGSAYVVIHIDVKSPSSRGANTLYKIRFNNVRTKAKLDETFKGDDILGEVDVERRKVQFSYIDDDFYVFMDEEDYSQYHLSKDMMEAQLPYVTEGSEGILGLKVNGEFVAIELPQSMVLEITECSPGVKGASGSARTKPATFVSGLVVQVPEYLEVGERVKVNTQEARYMSRA